MLKPLFFAAYSLAWRAAAPFLKRHKRLCEGYAERLVDGAWQELAEKNPVTVWIQAASGGEAYLALEILKYLPDNMPELHILCTSMTKQGMEVLAKGREAFERSWREKHGSRPCPAVSLRYFPFDGANHMQRAFALARPEICILLETELWPNFMRVCKERGSRLYVLNGRMTDKSYAAYKKIKGIFAGIQPNAVYATRQKDREYFQEIFPESRCAFMHNMKFDSIGRELEYVLHEKKENSLAKYFERGVCVYLLASVREEEERYLVPLAKRLHDEKKKSAVCIVPRHTARFAEWKKALEETGVPVRFVSELMGENGTVHAQDIVIWDRFGDLKELYGIADYAFVGGSLAPLGGQNFLEPLVYGVIPHTGIHLHNFLWTFETNGKGKNLAEENLLCLYGSPESLAETFLALPEKKFTQHSEIQRRFKTWLKPLTGDAKQVTEEIFSVLKKQEPPSDIHYDI